MVRHATAGNDVHAVRYSVIGAADVALVRRASRPLPIYRFTPKLLPESLTDTKDTTTDMPNFISVRRSNCTLMTPSSATRQRDGIVTRRRTRRRERERRPRESGRAHSDLLGSMSTTRYPKPKFKEAVNKAAPVNRPASGGACERAVDTTHVFLGKNSALYATFHLPHIPVKLHSQTDTAGATHCFKEPARGVQVDI